MELRQHCGSQERRQKVLASDKVVGGFEINGIDFIEVLDRDAPSEALRQKLIDVTFLKPDGVVDAGGDPLLAADNFLIEGGVRIKGIKVAEVEPGGPLTLRLSLDRAGDFSRYRLRLVDGSGGDDPPPSFDPVLSEIEFSFKADCPTDFDCLPLRPPPDEPGEAPAIDYHAKDYESFRRLMLDRMAVTIPLWTERSPADLGVTLVEVLAYGADMASYYQDAVATEAYLSRARLRASVRRHARLLGYGVDEGSNARVFVAIEAAQNAARTDPPLLPKGTMLLTRPPADKGFGLLPAALRPDPGPIGELIRAGVRVFETMEPLTRLRTARNALRFHTWSGTNCCLPPGTTVAYLVGTLAETGLAAGDVLILEERVPLGGGADDPPDPTHRQAVRLSELPRERVDALDDTPVLEVRWHHADALAFALNLQGAGGKPGAVAYANVVLGDDGRTLDYVDANGSSPGPLNATLAGRSGLLPETPPGDTPFRPLLADGPVTRAAPFDPVAMRLRPAADALNQDPAAALSVLTVAGGGETWEARGDLLLSDRFAPEFVVETRNDGGASLRFGDGRFGKGPVAGARYRAVVRVGNGSAGRIGAYAIGHVVTNDPALIDGVVNPLPATGGTDPETLTAIKLSAPRAFKRQKRAVTAEDYAAFVQKHPDVQRAVAARRWTGSWHTVFIAVDRAGGREVDAAFERELRASLEPFRLAGHDVEIEPPAHAPLDIALVVCVAPGHYAEHVEAALRDRLGAGLAVDGTPGFFHPDRFTFGQPVLLSPIIAAAMAIDGVRWVGMQIDGIAETGRFRRLDDQSIDYADSGLLPIGRREVARLDNDPNAPERGRLRFVMEGGR